MIASVDSGAPLNSWRQCLTDTSANAIGADPSYANAFRNRGLARAQQQAFDFAVADFDQAFRLNPAIGHGMEYALTLFERD